MVPAGPWRGPADSHPGMNYVCRTVGTLIAQPCTGKCKWVPVYTYPEVKGVECGYIYLEKSAIYVYTALSYGSSAVMACMDGYIWVSPFHFPHVYPYNSPQAIPFRRVAIWTSVGLIALQLKYFFGVRKATPDPGGAPDKLVWGSPSAEASSSLILVYP